MGAALKQATDAAYRRGLEDGRRDELVAVIRLVGRLARDVSADPVRLAELHRVQEALCAEQKRLHQKREKP